MAQTLHAAKFGVRRVTPDGPASLIGMHFESFLLQLALVCALALGAATHPTPLPQRSACHS